jgi:probable phosphoglycerate mutase
MQGRYKVKSPDLKPLFERASKLARQIPYFTIEHVRRELNRDADALANLALDSGDFSSAPQKTAMSPIASAAHTEALGLGDPASSGQASASANRSQGVALTPHRVRARYVRGVFVPDETVALAEGTAVLMEIEPIKNE